MTRLGAWFGLGLLVLLVGCKQHALCLNCEEAGAGGSSSRAGAGGKAGSDAGSSDDDDGGVAGTQGGGGMAGVPAACEPLGDEVCNAIDDDCDGKVDETFDFTSNPRHCGGCDHACQGLNAETACVDSQCVMKDCFPGFVDLDQEPGCEYMCPVSPPVVEDCNGIDDDCDGKVDETLTAPSAAAYCKHLKGTPCENVKLICATREGKTTWYCDYPSQVEFDPVVPDGIFPEETLCDGVDNDCDGQADEPWPELGNSCDDGKIGACADGGKMACAADKKSTHCDLSLPPDPVPGAGPSAPELCNGMDDDCDGVVDEPKGAPGTNPNYVIDDMVHVTHSALDFYIYKYEASRPDAAASDPGASAQRACSKSGALPWSYVTYSGAAAACTAAGLRLCTAAEWQAACEGAAASTYPYGASYEPDTCNGTNHDALSGGGIDNQALPAGELSMCVSADGAFDMSGNLKEWTDDMQGTSGSENIYVLRGGSYLSPELGLTCQTALSQASASTVLANVGFRCCSSTAP